MIESQHARRVTFGDGDRAQASAARVLEEVRRLAYFELLPSALRTDVYGVPDQHIEALREAGALNAQAPAEYGGVGLSPAQHRELSEVLAGACPNTWLVWSQHAAGVPLLLRLLEGSGAAPAGNPALEEVLSGRALAGAAISDVRNYPRRYISAERVHGGWVLNGAASWFSGWGLNRNLVVRAVVPDGAVRGDGAPEVLTAVIPLGEGIESTPLALSAMGGSRTVRLVFQDVVVHDREVVALQPYEDWQRQDRAMADTPQPQVFGLASRVLEELAADPLPEARALADEWIPYVARLRTRAYAVIDDPDSPGEVRRGLKIHAQEVLATVTRALLVAGGGRALSTDERAQLYARAAQFFLVQSQDSQVRRGQLRNFAAQAGDVPVWAE